MKTDNIQTLLGLQYKAVSESVIVPSVYLVFPTESRNLVYVLNWFQETRRLATNFVGFRRALSDLPATVRHVLKPTINPGDSYADK